MFRQNEDFRSDWKLGVWDAQLIGLFLVTLLGVFDFSTEVGMELVKIYGKIPGSVRSDINFRLNGDVWMITLIGEERGNTGRGVQRIVVGEFGSCSCKFNA